MATKGFNFRQSSGFVTDLGNDTYVRSGDSYPTTRNGVTFGWESAPGGDRDRNNAINAKCAGLCFDNGGNTDFRIDMSGSIKFRLALGDAGFAEVLQAIDIRDSLGSLDRVPASGTVNTLAEHFVDPAETDHASAALWATNNAQSAVLTVVSYARIRVEPGAPTCIAHVELEVQSAAAGRLTLLGVG